MTINICFCGYSYHTQQYYSQEERGVSDYLFRLQTEGSCEVELNRRKLEIKKGDLLLIKPGDEYELRIEEGQNSGDYYLFCEGSWVKEWWNRSPKPSVTRIDLDEKLLSLWRHIIIEERRPSTDKNKELTDYLLQALCLTLERAVNETSPAFSRPYVVTKMMRYIEEHATILFKIEEVAQHVDLSISRAGHLFKSNVGKTMIEYALEVRLSAAINQMKYTSMSLEQIAEICGFGTYPYFHRVFKKKYGVAPGIYRSLD
jgi:AraC family transcriptional regulator, arabinose operon regulatory protein